MNSAIELKPSQSKRVLECACRAQSEVRLLPKPWTTPHPITCRIVDSDDDGITLQARGRPAEGGNLSSGHGAVANLDAAYIARSGSRGFCGEQ